VSATTPPAQAGEDAGASNPNRWWTLGAVCIGIFMLLIDITVVNVALPDIQRELDASFSELQWVIDAYALTLAALMLTAGSIADRFGRRRVFAVGLGIFSVASLACGLAPSAVALDLLRGVQGIGGAVMFATSLALIGSAFSGKERGTAFGIFGATTGAALAVGPLVGGALTQGLGWEWIFFVNVPIGLAAMAVTLTRVEESRDPQAGRIDAPGVVTWSAALFLLIFALVRGNDAGWGSTQILACLIAAAVLLVAFVAREVRAESPMLDLSLFRVPSFAGAAIVGFTLSASLYSMFLYITLYLQNVLGYSPLAAGARLLPLTMLALLVAPISGRLTSRVPLRLPLGAAMVLVGIALVLMSTLDADSDWTALLPGFVLAGIGNGLVNPPLASTQIGVVEPRRGGMASGIGNTFRQVGIATGIAGYGALFQHDVEHKTVAALRGVDPSKLPDGLGQALSSGQIGQIAARLDPSVRESFEHAVRVGFTGALHELFLIGAVVAAVGAVGALALVRQRDLVSH
jgi:EmrB/QacA subfamily drug resistance transporter